MTRCNEVVTNAAGALFVCEGDAPHEHVAKQPYMRPLRDSEHTEIRRGGDGVVRCLLVEEANDGKANR